MGWTVKHDRDAFKEIWLTFANDQARFPLYPGQEAEITYSYTVSGDKWGPWFQRAVRVPTRELSVTLAFPSALKPTVWGTETSLTADFAPSARLPRGTSRGTRRSSRGAPGTLSFTPATAWNGDSPPRTPQRASPSP